MSWGKETCGVVSGGGKGNNQLIFFELDSVILYGSTTANVHLVPTIVTDGSIVYCAFVVGSDDAKLIEWQTKITNNGIVKVAIESTLYDDNRYFRYSVDFYEV